MHLAVSLPPSGRLDRWLEPWRRWRDTLLASPRFQRGAAAFWPGRAIARREAARLFDLVAGFTYSQVLLACVQLRVFELLADGPRPLEAIASATRLPPESAARLVRAACALGLLQRRAGGIGLGPQGAALRAQPGVQAMVRHHAQVYRDLADPVALLRGELPTGLNRYWAYAASDDPQTLDAQAVADYSRLMTQSQSLVAAEVLDAIDLERAACLLDVGGGEGNFLASAASRAPHLRLMLLDLPGVAARARERFERGDLVHLRDRVRVHGGDMLRAPLPTGADLITLVRVLHDHDDEPALTLLRVARAALPAGGRLVVAEPMAGTPGAQAMGDAYFGLYLLAMGSGRPRRPDEIAALLAQAGFARSRLRPTRQPLQTQVIEAWA